MRQRFPLRLMSCGGAMAAAAASLAIVPVGLGAGGAQRASETRGTARASFSRIYTIAGAESMVARLSSRAHGVATNVHLDAGCAGRLTDGTVVLCAGGLVRLGRDGSLRPWALHAADGAVVRLRPSVLSGAPDESLIAAENSSDSDVFRITSDGLVEVLGRPGAYVDGIAPLSDGSVLAALASDHRIVRLGPDGVVTPVAGNGRDGVSGDGGPALAARVGWPAAIATLRDGAFVFAAGGRVRRVGADGRITTVAGGGRGWREGVSATDVRLGEIRALEALPTGDLLMAGDRGVLKLGVDGVVRTMLPRTGNPTTDGLPTNRGGVRGPLDVIAQPDGGLLVLDQDEEAVDPNPRLAFIAPPGATRLAVALPPRNRTLLRRGQLVVSLTRPARVAVRIRRHRRVIARIASRELPAGATTLHVRVGRSSLTHLAEVTARADDGAVATHRLVFVPSTRLSGRIVRRIMGEIGASQGEDITTISYECRRRDARRFTCDMLDYEDGELFSRDRNAARVTLGRDGLVRAAGSLYEPG